MGNHVCGLEDSKETCREQQTTAWSLMCMCMHYNGTMELEAEPCKSQRIGRKEPDSWSQNQISPESALTDVVQNMI